MYTRQETPKIMKSKAAKVPNYISKILAKHRKGLPSGVYFVDVYHDDWCDLLNRKGPCNCNPDVSNARVPEELKSS
jgi:hypothetical protein